MSHCFEITVAGYRNVMKQTITRMQIRVFHNSYPKAYVVKILEIQEQGDQQKFKIHQLGCNARYDHWVPTWRLIEIPKIMPAKTPIFAVNEYCVCICPVDGKAYKSVTLEIREKEEYFFYKVHCLGWNSRYDQWLPESELFKGTVEEYLIANLTI